MKFTLILLTFITCAYMILSGLMSYYYDMWNRCIINYWWLKLYAILINLLLLASGPFFFKCLALYEKSDDSNDIVCMAMCLNSIISMSLVTYTILLRWPRERRLIALSLELKRLELEYFVKWSKDNDDMRILKRLLYAKVLVMLYQTMLHYTDSKNLKYKNDIESFMCIFYEVNMIHIKNGVIFQYFMGLWYICLRYHSNNRNLRYLVEQLKQMGSSAALILELRKLLDAHNELLRLISLLNKSFKFECLAVLLLYFTDNILAGYSAVFFAAGEMDDDDIFLIFILVSFYIGAVLDMLLLVWICDRILSACEETSIIMQKLMALSLSDINLNRICERFYLREACNKLRICFFNTFDINGHNGFAAISSIFLYTIFLVQSDYKNLVG